MSRAELAGRVNLLGPWLRRRFGGRVAKVGLDLGLGCPNRQPGRGGCAFCTPLAAGQGLGTLPLERQWDLGRERLAAAAARRGQTPPRMLAYLQAFTSTHAPAPRLAALYARVAALPEVAGVVISTRPDCLDRPRWEVLADLAARQPLWLELGLQSAHDPTLVAIDRGHDRTVFDAAVDQARARGIDVAAHVILGLPGETQRHTDATADHLARLGVWGVKLHQLMVLEGSRLAADWRAGRLTPWSLSQWAAATAGFLARLPEAMVVHRLAADPGPETLLAPDWAANKGLALDALGRYMLEHDLRQGVQWPKKP
ncbi:MAG: TIGR01212 family radical SAM protein [Desulfarculus sp.]|nr:TIGR01212 family radical SAM protein [Desulfarculus sp.]